MSIVGAFIMPHPPIILPEIGKGEEREIQRTTDACREVAGRIAALKPDTVVVTSPHSVLYADYFHISPGESAHGDFGRFGAPEVTVDVRYDSEFVRELTDAAGKAGLAAGTFGEREKSLDHGTMIPLRFLNEFYTDYQLVRIGLSGLSVLDHYRLGKCVAQTAEALGRRVVFLASGDLSHRLKEDGPYGFAKEGPKFDSQVTDAMAKGDFLRFLTFRPDFCDAAAECGLRSFIIMAGALDGKAVQPELLSYEGPFGVGYGVCAFQITGNDENRRFDAIYEAEEKRRLNRIQSQEDEYVKLARLSLETYVRTGERVKLPAGLPEEMLRRRAGAFVSLKKNGELRGCIGTIGPITDCVAKEIVRNAVSAGTEDPRFAPVTEQELSSLVYSVDVLDKPEPIDTIEELDVRRYGVIVTGGHKRGLLLPNLEGVDTPEQQVAIAMQKAGLRKGEPCSLERFEVVRHK
ncbi:AmmeMemoRadiSam system protein A [Caproiciproducens faecalis]|uniref:AmmeMemoRadiSam system protein A n=1 Tax=Caproiciproducens faecalis TaxID=2820301 RepID=A0ABS7DLX2_9FIRM|nr:AmmeMemoRadiSam system protein A [Caproiciproducens faecalis]MBW7572308.1 AmmeMemoRadiSam system protein A [Caproiciproducens faecalis]